MHQIQVSGRHSYEEDDASSEMSSTEPLHVASAPTSTSNSCNSSPARDLSSSEESKTALLPPSKNKLSSSSSKIQSQRYPGFAIHTVSNNRHGPHHTLKNQGQTKALQKSARVDEISLATVVSSTNRPVRIKGTKQIETSMVSTSHVHNHEGRPEITVKSDQTNRLPRPYCYPQTMGHIDHAALEHNTAPCNHQGQMPSASQKLTCIASLFTPFSNLFRSKESYDEQSVLNDHDSLLSQCNLDDVNEMKALLNTINHNLKLLQRKSKARPQLLSSKLAPVYFTT